MESHPQPKNESKTQQRIFRWSKRRALLIKTLIASAMVVLAALVGLVIVVTRQKNETSSVATNAVVTNTSEQAALAAQDSVRLTVNGESYDVRTETSLTVEQVMDQALELRPNDGAGMAFIYKKETTPGLGAFVTQVGAQEQQEDESLFWTYTLNGINATVGISEQRVVPGDVIEWRLAGPDAF